MSRFHSWRIGDPAMWLSAKGHVPCVVFDVVNDPVTRRTYATVRLLTGERRRVLISKLSPPLMGERELFKEGA